MQTRDKIIKAVAEELSLPKNVVRDIVMAQTMLVKKTMLEKSAKTVYLRKVGLFMPKEVRLRLAEERIERRQEKLKNKDNNEDCSDPLEF